MFNLVGMVQDYKSNVPLAMLESKYKVPIHTIIKVLYALTIKEGINNDEIDEVDKGNPVLRSDWNHRCRPHSES